MTDVSSIQHFSKNATAAGGASSATQDSLNPAHTRFPSEHTITSSDLNLPENTNYFYQMTDIGTGECRRAPHHGKQ